MNSQFIEQLQANPLVTVCDYYASRLADNPKAIEFLNRNALHCEAFPIGFSDRSLGKHIPKRLLKLGAAIRKQLEALGVYRDNGREHFRGMVTRNDLFHVDTFDLYHARSRRTFLAEAADETGAAEAQLRSDLGQVLLKLEELQHEQQQSKTPAVSAVSLTDAQQA
ncbi:MAG: hypothetical protein ABI557_17915, partial [Aureliella sp.]